VDDVTIEATFDQGGNQVMKFTTADRKW